jgi:SAM-dependent methyltransferase
MTEALHRLDRRTIREISALVADAHQRDEMAAPSYLHGNPLIRWLFWKRLEHAAELLGHGPFPSGLDFGCGLGLLLPTLSARTERTYGTDLELSPARQLVARLGLRRVELVEPGALPHTISDRALGYVVATDSLEHVDDLGAEIASFARMLAPGGALVVSGPTETGLYKLGRALAGFAGKGHYHHTNILEIRATIEGSGAFVLERTRVLPVPRLVEAFHVHRFRRRS